MTRPVRWLLIAVLAAAGACTPRAEQTETSEEETKDRAKYLANLRQYYAGIPEAVEAMLPRIRGHVRKLADLGPRQTGQAGCDKALAYVRAALADAAPECPIDETSLHATVTVPLDRTAPAQLDRVKDGQAEFSHVVVTGLGPRPRTWPAHALMPNCAQSCETHPPDHHAPGDDGRRPRCPNCERPRRLVDLGNGTWQDLGGKDLDGAVVLLDFNSDDAWLRAAELGAAGAVFIEPQRTTLFQADRKYLAVLPMHWPRLYVARDRGLALREALAAGRDVQVTLASRLRLRNVQARGLQLTVPGKDRSYCFVVAAHVDARCIVPDLSYGSAELWGIAELIELTRYLSAHPPNCDVRVMFVTGHWQSQRVVRDYIGHGGTEFDRVGRYYKLALSLDMVPEAKGLNLMTESAWDTQGRGTYRWIGNRTFNDGGWRDRIFDGMGLSRKDVELYGGQRGFLSLTGDGNMADRINRSAFVYAPRFPTAEQPFQALGRPTIAFQTCRLTRLAHNTPLDRLGGVDAASTDEQLRPQLKITLGMLRHLMDYPRKNLRDRGPYIRRGKTWGGYAQLSGRILEWNRSIGWFSQRLPGNEPGNPEGRPVRTFLHAYPTDGRTTGLIGARLRNFLHWPQNPSQVQLRGLQSFMFQDLRLLEAPHFDVKTIYSAFPETQYDVVAYGLDPAGRIRWATDYGIHGDGNKAFQCTDVDLAGRDTYVPVSMFECGTLELFGLVDPQRYNPVTYVYGTFYHHYGHLHADGGYCPYLRIAEVKSAESHTDMERWGFTQQRSAAMVFLPADYRVGAEVLIGSMFTNFAVLNNPGADGKARGYTLASGERRRPAEGRTICPLACVEQLAGLDQQRLDTFAAHDVASPLAKQFHSESAAAAAAADAAREAGDRRGESAHARRAWIFESQAYRDTLKLLLDVVATTVLYFVLLIPFSFLIERLVFPQRTALRTVLVSVIVFAVFAGLLYGFHPGFKLAHNVIVTATAFVIVVMTIPALILLLLRGVAMLRAIGSKRVITQQSEAESAGVVMASLSLAVSNMRRRRMRTALTLLTITVLVMALVLLTTSAAFDFQIMEPTGAGRASFSGIEIYNARDRRQPLLTELVETYEGVLADRAGTLRRQGVIDQPPLVLRRECVNYGYNPNLTIEGADWPSSGAAFLEAGGRKVVLPYLQLMDHRDDEVTYEYTFMESVPDAGGGKKTVERRAPITLSDLFKPQYDRPGDFLKPPRFEGQGAFLAEGDVDVVLLPSKIADALGVKVGDTVTLMGLPLTVKGIFASVVMKKETTTTETSLRDRLTRLPALPAGVLYVAVLIALTVAVQRLCLRQPAGLRRHVAHLALLAAFVTALVLAHPGFVTITTVKQLKDPTEVPVPGPIDQLLDLDGHSIVAMQGAEFRQGEADNPLHAPSSEVAIVPRAWARACGIFPSAVHSLVVVPRGATDPETVNRLASWLAREILNVDVFSHTTDPRTGRSVSQQIAMHTATHVKGSSMMLVILGVAVLMILAIMTGTVYERMREIHVFSSVGLSPRHVAGMFLIEALVYAGIAAVLGYFLGIIALKVLLHYVEDPNFYPNYLGVFVVYSIGMAVLATVASALYPIRLAGKIVNPSEGTWKLADGSDEENAWHIRLPFIATTWDEARSMMVYAFDYLVIHQGERSGRFVCERPPAGGIAGQAITLTMPVWLAPFERNLSQDVVLHARPAPDADWWELWLDLSRKSGPPYLWRRGATVFVNMLCKYLLRWRAATPEQEEDCLGRAPDVLEGQATA